MLTIFAKHIKYLYCTVLIIAVMLFYAPSLSFTLYSDDYKILQQVLNGIFINVPFYRPLLKFAMYGIYTISHGSDFAIHFYIIFWHLITVVALFFVTDFFNKKSNLQLSLFQVFIFVLWFAIFPFRGENIYWLVGSGAISALFFIIISFLFVIHKNSIFNYVLAALCFVIGILFYESVLLFPLIILMLAYFFPKILPLKKTQFILIFFIAFVGYVWSRNYFTGGITGTYSFLVTNSIPRLISTIFKFLYRSFFPAFQFKYSLIVPLLFCFTAIFFLAFRSKKSVFTKTFFILIALQIISFFPAAFVSIPVQNIEGDRLLYFSSLSSIILIFYFWIKHFKASDLFALGVIIYFSIFHFAHIQIWFAASDKIRSLQAFIEDKKMEHVIFLNKFDTYFGVPVFREGMLDFATFKTNVKSAKLSGYTLIEYRGEEEIKLQARNFSLNDSIKIQKINGEYFKVSEKKQESVFEKMIYFNGKNYQVLNE